MSEDCYRVFDGSLGCQLRRLAEYNSSGINRLFSLLRTIPVFCSRPQTTSPPESLSCASFNEEMLQANALFLVDQVESYDAVADPDENFLLSTPCMKHLVRLSSAKLSKRYQREKDSRTAIDDNAILNRRIKKRSDEHMPRKRPKQSKVRNDDSSVCLF